MSDIVIALLFSFCLLFFSAYIISKKDTVPSFGSCFFTLLGTFIVSFVVVILVEIVYEAIPFESSTSGQVSASQSLPSVDPSSDNKKQDQNSNSCEYVVTVDFNMDYNHHVGNDWSYKATVDKTVIYSDGTNIAASVGQEIDLYAKCVEHDDGSSDIGESSCYIVIEKGDIGQSFSVTDEVIVTENGGRYKGNTAKFTVTYYFDPV